MNLTIEATPEIYDLIGELNDVLGAAYESHQRHGLAIEQLFEPNVRLFLARLDGLAAGRTGVAIFDDYAEVKRMYTRPAARGRGVAKALLRKIVDETREAGKSVLCLETGTYQQEAIGLYEAMGLQPTGPFGTYAGNACSQHQDQPFFLKGARIARMISVSGDDGLRTLGFEPPGLHADPGAPCGDLPDPAQNPVSAAAADQRAGGGCAVPGSPVADREGAAPPRREHPPESGLRFVGRAARVAAGARKHCRRQPGKRQQTSTSLAQSGLDRPRQGDDRNPRPRSHRRLVASFGYLTAGEGVCAQPGTTRGFRRGRAAVVVPAAGKAEFARWCSVKRRPRRWRAAR